MNLKFKKFYFICFIELDAKLFFSGCMKNIKINGFLINTNDSLSTFDYINVRFDGCPNTSNKLLLNKLDQSNADSPLTRRNDTRVDTVYLGKSRFMYDTSFKPFTEYFYRVTASDPFGKSAVSDWFLIR